MYIVAQDGSGTHTGIQAAIDALAASGGQDRTVLVRPGCTGSGWWCIQAASGSWGRTRKTP